MSIISAVYDRVQNDGRYDPYLEQPIIVKGFISPLMQRSVDLEAEREALIDEMCHKIKECLMQKGKGSNGNDQ